MFILKCQLAKCLSKLAHASKLTLAYHLIILVLLNLDVVIQPEKLNMSNEWLYVTNKI